MDEAKEVRKGEALDWKKLEAYLLEIIPELNGSMKVTQFHGGHANLTYLVQFGEQEFIVRRPPFGKIAPGAHDMKREYRVLSKLYKHFPIAPRAYHLCEDESIIGAKFIVIEKRTGVVVRTKVLDCFKNFEKVEQRLIDAMIRAQADLHLIDYEAVDLTKLGRPEGFVERQLSGWAKRWELSKSENSEDMDAVLEALQKKIPTSQRISIIHNDLKLDNCQYQPDNPDKVTAIFDWDMCTLGDPLIDFGTTLSYYPDKSKQGFKSLRLEVEGNFPPKEFVIEKYQKYTSLSMEDISWYEAFAYWRGATVMQQLFKRFPDGETQDTRFANLEQTIKDNAIIARNILFG